MTDPAERPPLYPVFVDLTGRLVAVVGGGEEAERRVRALLPYGADVVVIAEETTDALDDMRVEGKVTIEQRAWEPGDLDGAILVVAATGSQEGDRAVATMVDGRGGLVRASAAPEASNLTAPATIRRGALQIALTTSGASAAVTKRVRLRLAEEFGEEWGAYLDLVVQVREAVRTKVEDPALGEQALDALMDERWLAQLQLGAHPTADDVLALASKELEREERGDAAGGEGEPTPDAAED